MFKWNYAAGLGVSLTQQQRFSFEALTLTRITDKKGKLAGEERKERLGEMENLMAELLHCCLTNESLPFEWHHWSLVFHSMPSSFSSSLSFFSHFQSAIHRPTPPSTIISRSHQRRQAIQVTIHGKHNSYTVNRTVYSLWFSITNSLTPANVLTHTRLMRDIINDDLWWLCLSLPR